MKVDKNSLTVDYHVQENGMGIACGPIGIPLRLEIASRILAAKAAGTNWIIQREHEEARKALDMADRLIAAHNATTHPTEREG